MDVTIDLLLDLRLYSLEEASEVEVVADDSQAAVYCWHSQGRQNWLSRGFSVVDVTGFVVLPVGLPDYIDMPDDV